MRLPVRISPSILSADFSRLGAEVEAITAAWVARTPLAEVLAVLQAAGIPTSPG